MASVYGYNTPGDMRVFYVNDTLSLSDGNLQKDKLQSKRNVWHYICTNGKTNIFSFIVQRAQLVSLLEDVMFNNTIFVPLDKDLLEKYSLNYFKNMSQELAYRIVKYSILQSKLEYYVFETMYSSALFPANSYDRIKFSNINGNITLNDNALVHKGDIVCDNGVILFINNIIYPYNYS